jgi:hypothetical protein
MTNKEIFEIANQYFNFIEGEWTTDNRGILEFVQAIYEEGYDQGCFEATGGQ